MPSPPVLIDDRFELIRLAARGGTADVYQATDHGSGNTVAVKILRDTDPAWRERAFREAETLSAIRHPSIVLYIADGQTPDGAPYLVTEWVEGETLRAKLRRGRLGVEESVNLIACVADALGAAHRRGLVHRDIKPGNILLPHREPARPKLIDFGLIRARHVPSHTLSGFILGTVGYMAPEHVRDAALADARSDVFSLGCVLFECLSGRAPFRADDVIGMIGKVLFDDTPRVTDYGGDIPQYLVALVARMMAKVAEQRPADGAVVAQLLRCASAEQAAPTNQDSVSGSGITERERRILSVILAGDMREEGPAGAQANDDLTTVSALLPAGILHDLVDPYGGVVDLLGTGLAIVSLRSAGAAADHANQAARCALDLRARMPLAPIALVTGRSDPDAALAVGEMFDRGALLLREAARSPKSLDDAAIRLDEVTAGLLGSRFEVAGERGQHVLRRIRREDFVRSVLLGRPSPCVGREREMASLDGVWAECLAEPRSRLVVVSGPAGIGKSRFRYEAAARLRTASPTAKLWRCEADVRRMGSPMALLRALLRTAIPLSLRERPDVQRNRISSRLSPVPSNAEVGRTADFLAEAAGLPPAPSPSDEFRAARANPVLMGDQIERAWVHFVQSECAQGPVAILLDDAHWADVPSIRLITASVRALPELPVLVVALARADGLGRLTDFLSADGSVRIDLERLSVAASEKLVRSVLPHTSAAVASRIVEVSQGNAFFLEELIRAEAEGKPAEGAETVRAMMQARLEQLEPFARRVLRAASVAGAEFPPGAVATLLGEPALAASLELTLNALAVSELLTVQPDRTGGRFSFRHALVRDAAYAMLTDQDRQLAHRLMAEWLVASGESDGWLLANHFLVAEQFEQAAQWFSRAAEQALEANDYTKAIECAERGAALTGSNVLQGTMLVTQAEAWRWFGKHDRAAAAAEQAISRLAPEHPAWLRALEEAIRAHARTGAKERARRLAWDLAALARSRACSLSECLSVCRVALGLLALGERTLARDLVALGAEACPADQRQDAVLEAYLSHAHATLMLQSDLHFDRYASALERTLQALGRVGDLRGRSVQRVNLGYTLMMMGNLGRARTMLEAALREAGPMGLNHITAAARHNLGYALALSGDHEKGLELELACVDSFAACNDQRLEGASREYVSRILRLMGRTQQAETEARRALELLGPFPSSRAGAVTALAIALAENGRFDEALEFLRNEPDPAEQGIENDCGYHLALAMAYVGLGRENLAREVLVQAWSVLAARAQTIADPSARRQYLEHAPNTAQILDLARRLGVCCDVA